MYSSFLVFFRRTVDICCTVLIGSGAPLSGVVPQSNERSHREKRVVPFSQEQFFSVVADVNEYKTFVPFCVDSKVVRVIDSQTIEADMSVGFKVGLN